MDYGTRDDLSRFEPQSFYKAASPDAKAYSAKVSGYSERGRTWPQKTRDYLSELVRTRTLL